MSLFDDAQEVSQCCWNMKQADYPRGSNRARINELFNGFPPYSKEEQEENNIEVNVNFLQSTRLAHDARSQFNNAFTKPGNYFTARTDMGPRHKRSRWGATVTSVMNRIMKRSLPYYECFRSKFALDVLHGIGPSVWPDQDHWCPDPCGVEDVLVPGNTLLTMKNLPFFAVYKSFSAPELLKLVHQNTRDPGWNMDLVDQCLSWIDSESVRLMGSTWPEIWAPEKLAERVKSDGGFYVADQIPTIECFDFYFFDGNSKDQGWRRRIILDSWSVSEEATRHPARKSGDIYRNDSQFLYDGRARKFADTREQLIAFQFADLSAVAPFRYHSVRSLGFLLYALCHLQNRILCRFNEAVFEALMMYFRVKSMDDVQRALKLELINRGFIDDGIQPLNANERYQVNAPLVQLGIGENTRLINENSASYVQQPNYSQGGVEKTKFQVMAETNAMTSLVSAGLNQAYMYQTFEYREIFRRFCKPLSNDPDVKAFRSACIARGVPEDMLQLDYWDIEPERVMGAGNKTLEMSIAQQLMEWRPFFDPEPQRDILRDAVLAITDDPARADALVPEDPVKITDSVHDAQLAAGTLMQGLPVGVKTGVNHIEYVRALMVSLAVAVQKAKANGNMATPSELIGMQNLLNHIGEHLAILAKDPTQKALVKELGDQLKILANEIKGFAQRLQQAMQEQAAQGNGNGGMDPKDQAKIQGMLAQTQAKIDSMQKSHAERTAQRQVQFQLEEQRKQQEHQLEMARQQQQDVLDLERQKVELQMDVQKKKVEIAADVAAKDIQARTAARREAAKPKPKK